MNFNHLVSTQIFILAFLLLFVESFPAPGPGGVSQVGFAIYRNKEEYEAARAQHFQNPHVTQNNEKVIVTYAVSHPSGLRSGNQGNYNNGADVSRNYYDYTQHFAHHQQHQKQIEALRQEQQRAGVNSDYYSGHSQSHHQKQNVASPVRVPLPVSASAPVPIPVPVPVSPYSKGNVAPVPTRSSVQRQQQQQQPKFNAGNPDTSVTNEGTATQQTYFSNNYLQKPAPVNALPEAQSASDLLQQQKLVALAKIAKAKNGKMSETLDLNELLDFSTPVKYY